MSLRLVSAAVLALSVSGCSCNPSGWVAEKLVEKATGVSVSEKDGKVTLKTKDGEVVLTGEGDDAVFAVKGKDGTDLVIGGSETKVPKDFPLPIVEGAKITGSMSMGKGDERGFFVTLEIPTNHRARVADFYERELRARGVEVERNEMEVNGYSTISLSGKGAGGIGSTVSIFDADTEAGRAANVTIAWERKPGRN